jgi:hypothetical protein
VIRAGVPWGHSSASRGVSPVDVAYIANKLRRYFMPVSLVQPPGSAQGATGNRNVAITATNAPNNVPDETAIIQLQGGVAVYPFKNKYTKAPAILPVAIGLAGDSNAHELYVDSLGYRSGTAPPSGAIIKSTYASDTRYVFVHVTGNPQ